MPFFSPDAESLQLSAMLHTLPPDVYERLKALELQITLENQRQRAQIDEELHTLRAQLSTMAREERQQQQTLRTTMLEAMDELRKEVAEALHRLSQDVERVAQHAEAQTNRVVERLRNDLLGTMLQRDNTLDQPRRLLGELFVTLGKQLQDAGRGELT